jgi:Carboxypeptidase regulatory-like domain
LGGKCIPQLMNTAAILILALLTAAQVERGTIRGEVHDAAGKPIAGARVDIENGSPFFSKAPYSGYLDCNKVAVTDENGRFEFTDLDPAMQFQLLSTAVGKKTTHSEWVQSSSSPVTIELCDGPANVPAARTIVGQIVDSSGMWAAHALVRPVGAKKKGNPNLWPGKVPDVDAATTDDEGTFKLFLPDDYEWLNLEIKGADSAGVEAGEIRPGTERKHRIYLRDGARVVGRVVHDGKPVAGQRVAVSQIQRGSGGRFIRAVAALTDRDGRFEFTHLPSIQPYVIFSPVALGEFPLVLATKRFNVGADGDAFDLGALDLVPSLRLTGRIVLPTGIELPPHSRLTLQRDPVWDLVSVDIQPDGAFNLAGLPPDTYEIHLAADNMEIDAAKMTYQIISYRNQMPNQFGIGITQNKDGLHIPVKIKTEPKPDEKAPGAQQGDVLFNQSLSGIVVAPNGAPVVGIRVVASPQAPVAGAVSPITKTGTDGAFLFGNLPAVPIELRVYSQQNEIDNGLQKRIRYMARAYPDIGQHDILIFYDASLNFSIEEIEPRPVESNGNK